MTRRRLFLVLALANFVALGACAGIAASASSAFVVVAFVLLAWVAAAALGLALGTWAASP